MLSTLWDGKHHIFSCLDPQLCKIDKKTGQFNKVCLPLVVYISFITDWKLNILIFQNVGTYRQHYLWVPLHIYRYILFQMISLKS